MHLDELIQTARGLRPCDLLLTNGRIVNVFSGEVHPGGVAVAGSRIAGLGDYPARRVVDLGGRFVAPGFIDSHVHIESSMACVTEFARAIVVHGTTAVVADPHEIANVLGKAGIRYMLESAKGQPINMFFTLPACVPATDMETAGARLAASDLEEFFTDPRVVGLGEMMNYPGVLNSDPDVLEKIAAARRCGRPVDGHCPGLSGRDLMAYAAAGILTDHECTGAREAQEKLAAGMRIMIRQGTAARNLAALVPIINARSARRLMWCTDDRNPHDLVAEGHIDSIVREAIRHGVDPITAVQMATLNPAESFGLSHLGAIAPGRQADLVVFSDLSAPVAEEVYCRGVLVAQGGTPAMGIAPPPVPVVPSMKVNPASLDFTVRRAGDRIRVIEIVPGQIITRQSVETAPVCGESLVSDPSRDLLKIAVVERHRGSGRMAIGFVRGLGLRRGALASSVAHDSHNIIAAGVAEADLHAAVERVIALGGGLVVAADGEIRAELPLPVAGLMSHAPVRALSAGTDQLVHAARDLGSPLKDPFMTLSFLALPVIPELKITDRGLVDVGRFAIVPLFA
jgi:adenine deaminase